MANKTTWQKGQSGNPGGRPPKARALTEVLLAVADEPCSDGEGGEVSRKRALARMLWALVLGGEVTFLASNREFGSNKTLALKPGEWFEVVRWLFAQVDGELSVKINEDLTEGDGPASGTGDNAPILYLPDNGRDPKKEYEEPPQEK